MAERPARRILIVVGSSLRAEEADRPLAYYMRQQIQDALERFEGAQAELARDFQVLVISDFRWLRDEPLQRWPTICLGGPGVNALAQHWLESLPLSLAVDDHYYVQMDPELDEPHVSIWGMDNPSTQLGVAAFLQRFGGRFLEHCLNHTPPEEESEEDETTGDDDD
jgi:hypothetical protein